MGIFGKQRKPPVVTTPPMTVVRIKKRSTTSAAAPGKKAPVAAPKAPRSEKDRASNKKVVDSHRPQCAAVTPAGAQCKNSARAGRKYCGSHKGFRPTAAGKSATDTAPRVAKAADTKPAARKAPAKKAAPKQFGRSGYLLYKNGPRYLFSKKAKPEKGWTRVNSIPTGFKVKVTPNGLPVLAKK
jgi:hypothetical protein